MRGMQNALNANPFVQSQRVKNLKSQPVFMDRQNIEDALMNPQYSEQLLRQTSWALSTTSYPMYRLMRLYPDLLSYRNYAYPKYVDSKTMKKPEFKSDSRLVHKWLDKFDVQTSFRRIAMEVAKEGKKAYIYRQNITNTTGKEEVDYALLQELPSDWWKITAKSENSYFVASMNFTYFWTPGTSVDQYPPIFRTYFNELMGCSKETPTGFQIDVNKTSSDTIIEYSGGNWYFWKELPSDLCWVFSFDDSNAWIVPPFMGLFLTAQDLSSYSLLQQQLLSVPLYGLLTAEIPYHDKASNKTGAYTNDLRLSDGMVTGFQQLFSTIAPPGVTLYPHPFTNMQYHKFEEVPNANGILMGALQEFIGTAGTTGLMSTTTKPSVAMVKSSQLIESRFIDILYGQFMKFVNTVFLVHLGLKTTWRCKIWGSIFTDENEKMALKEAITLGQTSLLPAYLSMFNQDIEDAVGISDYMDSVGIYNKFKIIATSFTTSGNKENGRPKIDENKIDNENTAASTDQGTNVSENKSFSTVCLHCGKAVNDKEYLPCCSEECKEEFMEIYNEDFENEDGAKNIVKDAR